MYGKLIDGALNIAPKKLPGDGTIVYNPPAEMYIAAGYKPVTFTDEPKAPEGFYYESGWEEQTDAIVQTWTLAPLPDDIDVAEVYDIIFGGAE